MIQAAYRRLAQKYHPDRSTGPEAIDADGRDQRGLGDRSANRAGGRHTTWRGGPPASRGVRRSCAGSGPPSPTSPAPGSAHRPRRDLAAVPRTLGGRRSRDRRRRCRGTGRPGARRSAAATTRRRCVRRTASGAAGPPPGNPSGSVLTFGRYSGWSLGEIGRTDLEYIEWLDRMPIGRPYRDEIDEILRRSGRRRSARRESTQRRGLFRRR